jgi:pimeloyl-ACP methyl ester carboxylesterase
VLVHGAGSGPWIFDEWRHRSLAVAAVDLQQGLDVGTASMSDYARVVVEACAHVRGPVALCGWSMGGLVAMMAARAIQAAALVVIEPSPPAEVQGRQDVADTTGAFDPEEIYGPFPPRIPSRPEAARARADRKRGISVPALPQRSLVVYGDDFEHERGRALAHHYGVAEAHFPGLSHWDLVVDPRVRERVFDFVLGGP